MAKKAEITAQLLTSLKTFVDGGGVVTITSGNISVVNRNDEVLSLQGSIDGGFLSLGTGTHEDSDGFYLAIHATGTEGILRVLPSGGDTGVFLPFFAGYSNPVLLKAVYYNALNTATGIYWFK